MTLVVNSGPLISLARIGQLDLLPQTGTVAILLTAKREGLIPALTPFLDQLKNQGIRLSSRLFEDARRLAGEE